MQYQGHRHGVSNGVKALEIQPGFTAIASVDVANADASA